MPETSEVINKSMIQQQEALGETRKKVTAIPAAPRVDLTAIGTYSPPSDPAKIFNKFSNAYIRGEVDKYEREDIARALIAAQGNEEYDPKTEAGKEALSQYRIDTSLATNVADIASRMDEYAQVTPSDFKAELNGILEGTVNILPEEDAQGRAYALTRGVELFKNVTSKQQVAYNNYIRDASRNAGRDDILVKMRIDGGVGSETTATIASLKDALSDPDAKQALTDAAFLSLNSGDVSLYEHLSNTGELAGVDTNVLNTLQNGYQAALKANSLADADMNRTSRNYNAVITNNAQYLSNKDVQEGYHEFKKQVIGSPEYQQLDPPQRMEYLANRMSGISERNGRVNDELAQFYSGNFLSPMEPDGTVKQSAVVAMQSMYNFMNGHSQALAARHVKDETALEFYTMAAQEYEFLGAAVGWDEVIRSVDARRRNLSSRDVADVDKIMQQEDTQTRLSSLYADSEQGWFGAAFQTVFGTVYEEGQVVKSWTELQNPDTLHARLDTATRHYLGKGHNLNDAVAFASQHVNKNTDMLFGSAVDNKGRPLSEQLGVRDEPDIVQGAVLTYLEDYMPDSFKKVRRGMRDGKVDVYVDQSTNSLVITPSTVFEGDPDDWFDLTDARTMIQDFEFFNQTMEYEPIVLPMADVKAGLDGIELRRLQGWSVPQD